MAMPQGKNGGKHASGEASLKLHFPDTISSISAYRALEAEADFAHRGGSRVKRLGKTVVVEIFSDDLVSLRASLNSYLRLMHIIKTLHKDTE